MTDRVRCGTTGACGTGKGGGYTPAEQERRERVRLQAAEWFEAGESTRTVAARLRVHERPVTRWREGGRPALLSKGPVSREKLSAAQWAARLDAELRRGPLAWGYAEDQCWTLGRVKTLIGRLFHIGYTIEGVGKLLHRHGWSVQVPARRAIERDEEAIALWKAEVWPAVKEPRRTWAPVSARPVVTVRGRGSGRVNMAGVLAFRDGERPHLFYRLHIYHGRKGEPKTFSWRDYRDLIVATHHHLGAPLVWCWDNLNVHLAGQLAGFAAENADWLRIVQLPAYAPELNPAEGVWSLLRRALANFAVTDLPGLVRIVKRKLKEIQYRPDLLTGCLTQTGLTLDTPAKP